MRWFTNVWYAERKQKNHFLMIVNDYWHSTHLKFILRFSPAETRKANFRNFFKNRVIHWLIQFIIPKAFLVELQSMINRKQILHGFCQIEPYLTYAKVLCLKVSKM